MQAALRPTIGPGSRELCPNDDSWRRAAACRGGEIPHNVRKPARDNDDAYVTYYMQSRTHLVLEEDALISRPVMPPSTGVSSRLSSGRARRTHFRAKDQWVYGATALGSAIALSSFTRLSHSQPLYSSPEDPMPACTHRLDFGQSVHCPSENCRPAGLLRRAIGLSLVVLLTSVAAGAQSADPLVRVLDVKRSTMAQEINRLADAGYHIALARLDPGLLIAHIGREPVARVYLFVEDLQTFLAGHRLEPGYRFLPQSLSPAGKPHCAVFEKRENDDRLREYAFVKGSSAGDVENKARKTLGDGFVPVAINTEGEAVAVFERTPEAGPWRMLATKSTGTMEKELAAAAAEGYRVVAAAGGIELTFALVQHAGSQPVEYRLLSATRATTLERELNDAAAQGFRFVPASLAALKGGFLFRGTNEAAIVVERSSAEPAVTYRIVGARRTSTIEKEADEPASRGFTIAAALAGYEETVVILASSREATTTVR